MRALVRQVWDGFDANDLLTSASAISFQVLTALVPGLLFVLALTGFLGLQDVWRDHVRPTFASEVSPAVLQVADDTVGKVLGRQEVWWVTFGAVLAIWQLSGAVRAVMGVLNRIYGVAEDRGWKQRYGLSLALAVATGGLLVTATAEATLLPLVDGNPPNWISLIEGVGRWGLAAGLMLLAVGLLVHHCPNGKHPRGWASVGAVLVVTGWTGMTGLFWVYLTQLASYGSVFGDLATIVILFAYLYLVAVVFVGGLQLDALLRERHGAQHPGDSLTEGKHARS